MSKKAVIFAPFWRQAGHVGNYRVDRFVRWLAEDGFHVLMIRAGSIDERHEESWGTELTVRDPLRLYRDANASGVQPKARKPNKLRRALAYWLFSPDPDVVWARRAARDPSVLEAAAGAAFVLSSSPSESAHVGAWMLSRRLTLPHIVDMRDGWLDDPLRPMLRTSALRRWRESRLEARILRDASAIQVTSDVWKAMLCRRLPDLTNRVTVLTNSYPPIMPKKVRAQRERGEELLLIHAGRFLGSRPTQSPDLLLQPLLCNLKHTGNHGTIKLIGSLSTKDRELIERFVGPFSEYGWHIECARSLPRHEFLELLPQADGLLLLSASYAVIPSKLFEYIPTGRPILAVTERESATWRICEKLPQAVLVESNKNNGDVRGFLEMAASTGFRSVVPNEYTEESTKSILLAVARRA